MTFAATTAATEAAEASVDDRKERAHLHLRTGFHDQGGIEAQIEKNGEFMVGRRFEEGWQTLQSAEEERKFIENGGG